MEEKGRGCAVWIFGRTNEILSVCLIRASQRISHSSSRSSIKRSDADVLRGLLLCFSGITALHCQAGRHVYLHVNFQRHQKDDRERGSRGREGGQPSWDDPDVSHWSDGHHKWGGGSFFINKGNDTCWIHRNNLRTVKRQIIYPAHCMFETLFIVLIILHKTLLWSTLINHLACPWRYLEGITSGVLAFNSPMDHETAEGIIHRLF